MAPLGQLLIWHHALIAGTHHSRSVRFSGLRLAPMFSTFLVLNARTRLSSCRDLVMPGICVVISGPMRFEYHEENKRWVNTRDGETELRVILAAEMRDKCGVSL